MYSLRRVHTIYYILNYFMVVQGLLWTKMHPPLEDLIWSDAKACCKEDFFHTGFSTVSRAFNWILWQTRKVMTVFCIIYPCFCCNYACVKTLRVFVLFLIWIYYLFWFLLSRGILLLLINTDTSIKRNTLPKLKFPKLCS